MAARSSAPSVGAQRGQMPILVKPSVVDSQSTALAIANYPKAYPYLCLRGGTWLYLPRGRSHRLSIRCSLFQIAVKSLFDVDLQKARQQPLSSHFLEWLGIAFVVFLGQDDDAPKIKWHFH
jgi:hypothetical protein